MPDSSQVAGALPPAFLSVGTPSFADFLRGHAPELLPGGRPLPEAARVGLDVPHGTTIVATTFPGGVVMSGDRRATMGNVIAQRDIEKVFPADEYSCVGIAGTAGLAVELVRLFQVELEHYEKVEASALSLDGKANQLSTMVRSNLPAALQGLAVVPLFAGYDHETEGGRIFSYDVTGGRYEEHAFHAVGSGSMFARGSLKKLYGPDLSDGDDSATGGPDLARRIYPVVAVVSADGFRRLPDDEVGGIVNTVVQARLRQPDGPTAPRSS